ncbi:MAG: class I SAM-dependent methyltransferase [Pseudomonadota bacterium]
MSADFWNRIAARYARDPISDMAGYQATLERTKHYLTPTAHVLELGAGTSSTALELASRVARYHATDVSSEMVRIGRQKAEGTSIEITVADADAPELHTGDYDAVLAFNLLHLVPDPARTLAHVRKMLGPGGVFISKTACLGDAALARRSLIGAMIPIMQVLGKAPRPVHFLRGPALLEMIRAAGFDILEETSSGAALPRHYIVARKV